MGNSFQEQLLKAGLVSKKQVGKVKHEQRIQNQAERKGKSPVLPAEGKLAAQRQLAEKAERARALNRERDRESGEKAALASARQLIEQNRLPLPRGERPYHFSDGNKIKKLYTGQETVEQLSQGRIAIVKAEGKYELVPATIIAKLRERDPQCVVAYNPPAATKDSDPEDPYAAFPIPDDYEW